jgi:hypothetical protein
MHYENEKPNQGIPGFQICRGYGLHHLHVRRRGSMLVLFFSFLFCKSLNDSKFQWEEATPNLVTIQD